MEGALVKTPPNVGEWLSEGKPIANSESGDNSRAVQGRLRL